MPGWASKGDVLELATLWYVKFIYSEKATKFCEISTNYLFNVLPVKYLVEISLNFVAFAKYMSFNRISALLTQVSGAK